MERAKKAPSRKIIIACGLSIGVENAADGPRASGQFAKHG